jgi:DNA repair protein RadD
VIAPVVAESLFDPSATEAREPPPSFTPAPELRAYQRAAVDAVYRHLRERDDNPCVVLPTGAGKSLVIAQLCRDAVELWSGRVLVLAHVRELLEQTHAKLMALVPELDVGLHSAGLNRRDSRNAVVVAGIQSVYDKAERLGRFDLAIVDEAHLLPPDGDGMYRRLFAELRAANPELRVIGLTATPFRMSSGPICAPPPEGILNTVCYEVGIRELIAGGYLSPLRSKSGTLKPDLDQLAVRGGEFVSGDVEAAMDTDRLVTSACAEIARHTRDRRSCLVFAAGVKHGQHVARTLEAIVGVEVGFIDGQTPTLFRDVLIQRFRSGELKYLCNVNVLTTGFDAPCIDCVALLRPTMSPGLFYQQVGRGFRTAPGKIDCLVLDFGGNVLRHGPVDQLRVKDPRSTHADPGPPPVKECPACQELVPLSTRVCPACAHEFPPEQRVRHDGAADGSGILAGEVTVVEHVVQSVQYAVHQKRGAPDDAPRSMRVDYAVGFNRYQSEWVCFEHVGYARQKACAWWRARSTWLVPDSAQEAVDLAGAGALAEPTTIRVRIVAGEPYARIVDVDLAPNPNAHTVPPPELCSTGEMSLAEGDFDRTAPDPDYQPALDDVPF